MVYKHTQVCPNAAPAPSYGAVFGQKPYKSTIMSMLDKIVGLC